MRIALASALVAAVILAACSADPAADVVDEQPLEGVIIAIDSEAIDDITSFTLKDGDNTYEIYIADDVDYGFPLGHLSEHVQSAGPVAVETEERDGKLYALSIEDV
jgi:hypothetical protein